MKEYAVYKGDEFLAIGTAKELAEKFNVRPQAISYWATPSYQKKGTGERGRKIAIPLEDDDDDDE